MTASMCMSFSSLLFAPIRYWAQPTLSSKSSVCLACPLRSFHQFCTLQPRIHGPLKGGPDHSLHQLPNSFVNGMDIDSSNDLLDFVIQRMPVAHQDGDQPTDLQMDSRPPGVAFGSDGAQSVEALFSLDLLTSLIDRSRGARLPGLPLLQRSPPALQFGASSRNVKQAKCQSVTWMNGLTTFPLSLSTILVKPHPMKTLSSLALV